MKKRNLLVAAAAVTVVAALAAGLSGCKNSKKDGDATEDATKTEETTEETTTASEETSEGTTQEKATEEDTAGEEVIVETTSGVEANDAAGATENANATQTQKGDNAVSLDEIEKGTTKDQADEKETKASEFDWSGSFESEGNAGSTQFTIQKTGDGYTVSGDGIDGDKYGEISGPLTKVNDTTYTYQDGEATLTFTYKNGQVTVVQNGEVGDQGFNFSGTYNKI